MTARSLSDITRSQEAQIETLLGMVRDLIEVQASTLAALTERRSVTASESVTLSRSKLGDKADGIDVTVVPQEGETLEDAVKRGAKLYEASAARYPLPNGEAHAGQLGESLEDQLRRSIEPQSLKAVPDPEPKR